MHDRFSKYVITSKESHIDKSTYPSKPANHIGYFLYHGRGGVTVQGIYRYRY